MSNKNIWNSEDDLVSQHLWNCLGIATHKQELKILMKVLNFDKDTEKNWDGEGCDRNESFQSNSFHKAHTLMLTSGGSIYFSFCVHQMQLWNMKNTTVYYYYNYSYSCN